VTDPRLGTVHSEADDIAPWRRRLDLAVVGAVGGPAGWLVRHWLALFNLVALATVVGALATPFLREAGLADPAAVVERAYRWICLQRPDHSFFLLGHQVPLEQRMLAMAAAQFVGGLLYAKARGHLPPLDWRLLVVGFLPATLDVVSQMLGWRESTGLLRTFTGWLFSLALVLWAYPLIDRALARGPSRA
jgi:uncharacterized membrane protein